MSSYFITVDYDGKYPNLCSGIWTITIDEQTFKTEKYDTECFETYGNYSKWSFKENWDVTWYTYEDGLDCSEWIEHIKENDTNGLYSWLVEHFPPEDIDNILLMLFGPIQERDFRSSSCGGCI